jgi:glycosyltransferase involved in cell wall biosynthesis
VNLGIEASNIIEGGGLHHLVELLTKLDLSKVNIKKIVVWSSQKTLDSLPDSSYLIKKSHKLLNSGKLNRLIWQIIKSKREFKDNSINILFVPGGIYLGSYNIPVIAMSQNMLLYEWKEMARYGFSKDILRLILLFFLQSYTFLRSSNLLFLTEYAKKTVSKKLKLNLEKSVVIPHGINPKFNSRNHLKKRKKIGIGKINLLYVSFIGMYKHQWKVVESIYKLRKMGYDIQLTLIGNSVEKKADRLFRFALEKYDPNFEFVNHKTGINYQQIQVEYKKADAFIYASSCENMPMILMEAMRSGLPIFSSNLGPMPEILGEAGEYFNPDYPDESVTIIDRTFKDEKRLLEMATKGYEKSLKYTWRTTQDLTFSYFEKLNKEIMDK